MAEGLANDRNTNAIQRVGYWGGNLASWARLYRSREEVQHYQRQAFLRMVRHAGSNVPYYRRLFKSAGLFPDRLHGLPDTALIPISDKSHLQSVPLEDRLSDGVRLSDCRVRETSGSTGEPMRIARTPDEETRLYGLRLRVQVLGGLRPWHRRVILGATPREFLAHRLGLFSVSGIPLEATATEIAEQLEIRRPHVLKGPPTTLELLLDEAPDCLSKLGLKLVLAGAEHLPRRTRLRLEQICGCPVVELYGAVECNLIAWQCLRCGIYHTCDDGVLVEVLRDGRPAEPGETGDVVITALHSFAMPCIRYRLGDVVRLPKTQPPCNIGFGAIESIEGRAVEYLKFPGSPKISPYTLIEELGAIENVARFEAEQTGPRSLLVYFLPRSTAQIGELAALIETRCGRVLPSGVEVRACAVDRFEQTPGEKRRFIRARKASPLAS